MQKIVLRRPLQCTSAATIIPGASSADPSHPRRYERPGRTHAQPDPHGDLNRAYADGDLSRAYADGYGDTRISTGGGGRVDLKPARTNALR